MSRTVVVVGSGSAGRRHAAAVRDRLPDAELLVVRRPQSTQPVELFEELGAVLVPSLDAALSAEPSFAIVAGPATQHRSATERLLHSGATVLVEKPLAATSADGLAIAAAAAASDRAVVLGYHLRCAETVSALRSLLGSNAVGEVVGFDLRVGQHLDQWRVGADPRAGVSGRQDLGGGVLLELSHELDALAHLLGPVATIRAEVRTDGAPTDGIVETVAELDVTLRNGTAGKVHLDMVSDPPFRSWVVTGARGSLNADLLAGTIELRTADGVQVVHRSGPDERNRAEEQLIENLITVAAGSAQPVCSVEDGLEVLAVIDAARRSVVSGADVRVEPLVSAPSPDRAGATT